MFLKRYCFTMTPQAIRAPRSILRGRIRHVLVSEFMDDEGTAASLSNNVFSPSDNVTRLVRV